MKNLLVCAVFAAIALSACSGKKEQEVSFNNPRPFAALKFFRYKSTIVETTSKARTVTPAGFLFVHNICG